MYQKLVTVYSKHERRMLHSQGIWVNQDGEQQPVRLMSYERLDKLVKMLATWALNDEGNVYQNLRNMPIFVHVVLSIRDRGLFNFQAQMFLDAYAGKM